MSKNVLIPLLVWKDGASQELLSANVTPKIKWVPSDSIEEIKPGASFGSDVVVRVGGYQKELSVYQTPRQIKAAEDPSSANVWGQFDLALGAAAAGSAQGAGLAISKYLTVVATATDTSAEAIDLPAATVGDVHAVINTTAVALEDFPASGETINGAAANAVYNQAAGSIVYFYCKVAGEWEVLVG